MSQFVAEYDKYAYITDTSFMCWGNWKFCWHSAGIDINSQLICIVPLLSVIKYHLTRNYQYLWHARLILCVLNIQSSVEHVWNLMAHTKKPDLVFQRNGQVHLNWQSFQLIRLLAAEVCATAVVMLDTPCSEVECNITGNTLHSHVSPSFPLPCITMCHQVSTELYLIGYKITT